MSSVAEMFNMTDILPRLKPVGFCGQPYQAGAALGVSVLPLHTSLSVCNRSVLLATGTDEYRPNIPVPSTHHSNPEEFCRMLIPLVCARRTQVRDDLVANSMNENPYIFCGMSGMYGFIPRLKLVGFLLRSS